MLLVSFLLFPVTYAYLSPYVIIMAASMGIMNGSMIVFIALLVSAIFFGRLWCGWLCPGGAIQELVFPINDRSLPIKKIDWIKWVIWGIWLGLIILLLIMAGGIRQVMPLLGIESGISLMDIHMYIIYYIVLLAIVLPSLIWGKRLMCHTFCWMAPFTILGRKLANLLNLPAVRLKANTPACIHCARCTVACPMSLPVQEMVENSRMEHSECILCKNCMAACPNDVIELKIAHL